MIKTIIGGGESPTFITSNSEEESKIKFYFLLRHYKIDITNNYINKELIDESNFKFEKRDTHIIMHDDNDEDNNDFKKF